MEIRQASANEHPWAPLVEWHCARAQEILDAEKLAQNESIRDFTRSLCVLDVMKQEGISLPSRDGHIGANRNLRMIQRPIISNDLVRLLRSEIIEMHRSMSPALRYLAPETYEMIQSLAKLAMIMFPAEAGMKDDDPRVCSYEEWEDGKGMMIRED